MPALTETIRGATSEEFGHAAIEATITVSADTEKAAERLIDEQAKKLMGASGETPVIWHRQAPG